MVLRAEPAPFQIETGRWRAYLVDKKRDCVESVRGMRKWKTAIIGCYDVLGGN